MSLHIQAHHTPCCRVNFYCKASAMCHAQKHEAQTLTLLQSGAIVVHASASSRASFHRAKDALAADLLLYITAKGSTALLGMPAKPLRVTSVCKLMAIYSSIVNKLKTSNHSAPNTARIGHIMTSSLCVTTLMCCCLQVQLSMSKCML